eukprot:13949615-Alexandrium_andersonii.AAC.1
MTVCDIPESARRYGIFPPAVACTKGPIWEGCDAEAYQFDHRLQGLTGMLPQASTHTIHYVVSVLRGHVDHAMELPRAMTGQAGVHTVHTDGSVWNAMQPECE